MEIDWTMVGALGTCFGAVATFCAVIVALAQASKAMRTSATVSFTMKTNDSWGKEDGRDQTFIYMEIVNTGLIPLSIRTIRVTGLLSGEIIEFPITTKHYDAGKSSVAILPGQIDERVYRLWDVVIDGKRPGSLRALSRMLLGPFRLCVVETSGKRYKGKASTATLKAIMRFEEQCWAKDESGYSA